MFTASGYWSPDVNDMEPYLEVAFDKLMEVTAITSRGDEVNSRMLQYTVTYMVEDNWVSVKSVVTNSEGLEYIQKAVFTGEIIHIRLHKIVTLMFRKYWCC